MPVESKFLRLRASTARHPIAIGFTENRYRDFHRDSGSSWRVMLGSSGLHRTRIKPLSEGHFSQSLAMMGNDDSVNLRDS
jgi:hypothetical protein